MTDHLSQIKQALEAGPTGGRWMVHGLYVRNLVGTYVADVKLDEDDREAKANAALIASCNPTAIRSLIERLEAAERDAQAKQAKIDALMLEYCPDEMTPEQVEEWGRHQVPVGKDTK